MTTWQGWGFLLNQLCEVAGISHGLVVSGDGLLLAADQRLLKDHADQLSAVTSGLSSLTTGAAQLMNADPVQHTLVTMAGGNLIVMAIDDRSILTVLATKDCDLSQVVYEMATFINQVGAALTPGPRRHLPAIAAP
jgi:predicted regulator of Ras-like GTPase activity (Roadblock/LC7/MglB family)